MDDVNDVKMMKSFFFVVNDTSRSLKGLAGGCVSACIQGEQSSLNHVNNTAMLKIIIQKQVMVLLDYWTHWA